MLKNKIKKKFKKVAKRVDLKNPNRKKKNCNW